VGGGREQTMRSGTSDEQEYVRRIDKIEVSILPMVLKYLFLINPMMLVLRIKVKLSLRLIKHYDMKTFWGVGV
jgi:hypothetical protein